MPCCIRRSCPRLFKVGPSSVEIAQDWSMPATGDEELAVVCRICRHKIAKYGSNLAGLGPMRVEVALNRPKQDRHTQVRLNVGRARPNWTPPASLPQQCNELNPIVAKARQDLFHTTVPRRNSRSFVYPEICASLLLEGSLTEVAVQIWCSFACFRALNVRLLCPPGSLYKACPTNSRAHNAAAVAIIYAH